MGLFTIGFVIAMALFMIRFAKKQELPRFFLRSSAEINRISLGSGPGHAAAGKSGCCS